MKKMLQFGSAYILNVLESLNMIHIGTFEGKIFAAMKLAFYLSPAAVVIMDVRGWYIDNIDYVTVVGWAILVDYVLGTIKHAFLDRDFSIKRNISGVLTKVGLIVAVGFLFEGLNVIVTRQSVVADYMEIVARLIVFLYPAGSAFGNSSRLSNGAFPPAGWIKRLNRFSQNANPKVFTENMRDEEYNVTVNTQTTDIKDADKKHNYFRK